MCERCSLRWSRIVGMMSLACSKRRANLRAVGSFFLFMGGPYPERALTLPQLKTGASGARSISGVGVTLPGKVGQGGARSGYNTDISW